MNRAYIVGLIIFNVLMLVLSAWAIYREIKNDPPYYQWWDDESEGNDDSGRKNF